MCQCCGDCCQLVSPSGDVTILFITYCHMSGVHVTKWRGSSSDDWILLAVRLQPLLITLSHNTIAILQTLQSLHTNTFSLFPLVFTIHFLAQSYNTWTIKVSLKYTLPISLHFGTSSQIRVQKVVLPDQSQRSPVTIVAVLQVGW
jgi:hypothetical protein